VGRFLFPEGRVWPREERRYSARNTIERGHVRLTANRLPVDRGDIEGVAAEDRHRNHAVALEIDRITRVARLDVDRRLDGAAAEVGGAVGHPPAASTTAIGPTSELRTPSVNSLGPVAVR